MISVLIPVYNYSIVSLVESLYLQFKNIDCEWEILLSDDCSNVDFRSVNSRFLAGLSHNHIKLYQQEKNIGNGANRNYLIEQASFDWLLFLDADVLPTKCNFLSNYRNAMKVSTQDIIGGNIIYNYENPLPHLLRWKYGKAKEEKTILERKNNPILHLRGANFAIRKELAKKKKFLVLQEKYGFVDTRFFLQFNENQIYMIENPVYHLGIEENNIFIEKTKKAITNAFYLMNENDEVCNQISLIANYKKVRFFKKILAKGYSIFKLYFEIKLLSNKPSIAVFQIYKLMYLSCLDVSKGRH